MSSPFGPLYVIANPRAGRGRVAQELPELERALRRRGLEYEIVETRAPGDAERLAREALRDGHRFLVAVGGDGTVNEVVNGMIEGDRPVEPEAVLGVVAAGSGNDFVKTFGLAGDATRGSAILAGDRLFPIDAGKVTYTTAEGATASRYFAGIAEAGLGGAMTARSARLPKGLGRGRDFLGFWFALSRFKAPEITLRVGDTEVGGTANDVVVANCQFQNGGMRISPRSWPSDGLLDVLVFRGPRSEAFTRLPKLYHGDYLPDPNVGEYKGRTITLDAERPLPIQADGDVLGTTPATFELIRLPIRLKL
ncbi:MAG: diacylglycerol/lipid kinase family protein [Actinomycetota bacterium]